MHYGIEIVPLGPFADPKNVVRFARAAEAAGWEGITLWDHLLFPYGVGDPWVTLAAVAGATKHMRLISGVAPLPRYQPHLLARTLTALDILSSGRVIFGTGLGVAWDLTPFGVSGDDKIRAAMTDEGLDLLTRLWAGEEVTSHGHYPLESVCLTPSPIQQPRIPIWIGGESRAALRRAARWDGWIMGTIDEQCQITNPPEKIAAQVATIMSHRSSAAPFDIGITCVSQAGETDRARAYQQAGATWWFEAIFGTRASLEELLERVIAGPPR